MCLLIRQTFRWPSFWGSDHNRAHPGPTTAMRDTRSRRHCSTNASRRPSSDTGECRMTLGASVTKILHSTNSEHSDPPRARSARGSLGGSSPRFEDPAYLNLRPLPVRRRDLHARAHAGTAFVVLPVGLRLDAVVTRAGTSANRDDATRLVALGTRANTDLHFAIDVLQACTRAIMRVVAEMAIRGRTRRCARPARCERFATWSCPRSRVRAGMPRTKIEGV